MDVSGRTATRKGPIDSAVTDGSWKGGRCGFSFVPLCHGARVRNNFRYALLSSRTSGRGLHV